MSTVSKHNSTDMLNDIGKRIRELRILKGMTQAELVCEDITRNMLSRIENGAALPSLPTLCCLADRLDVPIGALLGNLDEYMKMKSEQEFVRLYAEENFKVMIERFEETERSLISANSAELVCRAYIAAAKEAYEKGELTAAGSSLDKARQLTVGDSSVFSALSNEIYLLSALISACPAIYDSDKPEFAPDTADRLTSIIYDNNSCAVYLFALSRLNGLTHSAYSMPIEKAPSLCAELTPMISGITNNVYRTHIEAKLDLINADYLGAKAKLITLLHPIPPQAILYDIYRDLEFCCKCCGDFENAYKYSTARLELAKKIN